MWETSYYLIFDHFPSEIICKLTQREREENQSSLPRIIRKKDCWSSNAAFTSKNFPKEPAGSNHLKPHSTSMVNMEKYALVDYGILYEENRVEIASKPPHSPAKRPKSKFCPTKNMKVTSRGSSTRKHWDQKLRKLYIWNYFVDVRRRTRNLPGFKIISGVNDVWTGPTTRMSAKLPICFAYHRSAIVSWSAPGGGIVLRSTEIHVRWLGGDSIPCSITEGNVKRGIFFVHYQYLFVRYFCSGCGHYLIRLPISLFLSIKVLFCTFLPTSQISAYFENLLFLCC